MVAQADTAIWREFSAASGRGICRAQARRFQVSSHSDRLHPCAVVPREPRRLRHPVQRTPAPDYLAIIMPLLKENAG